MVKSKQLLNLRNTLFYIVLMLGMLPGCVSNRDKSYTKEMVDTYAEISLLYEDEKMTKRLDDSLYQVKVKEYFKNKGLQQRDFYEQTEELVKDVQAWRLFIRDVSTAIDSIKILKSGRQG